MVLPKTIFAASVYFTSNSQNIYPDDVFVVDAKISSPTELINVADGAFLFDQNILKVKELSTGGSVFSLWAQQPTFSNETGRISFIGGTHEGFQGENGLILKAIFLAKKEGESQLAFSDGFSVFLSDGKGTKINPKKKPFTFSILKRPPQISPRDEWQTLIKEDKIPPKFSEAIISRDSHLFDNQYFVSFFAIDKDSGIAYYEIKEGDRDFVRAKSPYLLQDQSLKGVVKIKAVDIAGNESIVVSELAPIPGISYKIYLIWVMVIIVSMAFIFWLRWLLKTKLRNSIQK